MAKNKYLLMFLALLIILFSVNCSFSADANDTVKSVSDQTDNNINKDFTVEMDEIKDTSIEKDLKISGKVIVNNETAVRRRHIGIYIYSKPYGENISDFDTGAQINLDNNRKFSFTYKPKFAGQYDIKVEYFTAHSESFANQSVYVAPKSTVVTMDSIKNIDLDENITLHGQLTDAKGNILKYTSVGILISGTPYGDKEKVQYSKEYTRTDVNGYYTYTYKPSVGGSLDVCVYYPGYHNYRFNRTDSHIWVMPKGTKVSANIENLTDNEIAIYGTLTDVNDKPLRYTSIGILFNGKNKTYVKTDMNGNYNITYIPVGGKNNITVYYPGYHYYRFNETQVEFNIIKPEAIITVNPIKPRYVGDDIIIHGKVTDEQGNPIYNPHPNSGGGGGSVDSVDFNLIENDAVVGILESQYNNHGKSYFAYETLYQEDGSFEIWFDYYAYEIIESEITMPIYYTGNVNYSPTNITVTFPYKARPN